MMQSSIHFPPFRQGRSVRQTEAVGQAVPPVSPCPSRAHPPPHQCHSAPSPVPARLPGVLGEPMGAACLMAGQGLLLGGSPGTGGAVLCLLYKGAKLHRVSPTSCGRHRYALIYHPGQRETGTGEPVHSKPTGNARHTHITGGKIWLGGVGTRNARPVAPRGHVRTHMVGSAAQPWCPSPAGEAASSPPHRLPRPTQTDGAGHPPRVPAPLPCPACAPSLFPRLPLHSPQALFVSKVFLPSPFALPASSQPRGTCGCHPQPQ